MSRVFRITFDKIPLDIEGLNKLQKTNSKLTTIRKESDCNLKVIIT